MDTRLFVYVDLASAPQLVGQLWSHSRRDRESASFEYANSWLHHPDRFALEPALTLGKGPHHTAPDRTLFGAIGDSAPDRWGRALIQRAQRRKARAEGHAPRALAEIDYLLAVSDFARQGALRFAEQEGGPFLAPEDKAQIPPLVRLRALMNAALRITADEETDDDLKLLLAPGSSLGGARPKASVIDPQGDLLIAKFPHHADQVRISLWEALALKLAEKAAIPTPNWRVEIIGGKAILILRRFDRAGDRRIPFLSAMSMLGAMDAEPHSYLEIADAVRQYGARAEEDCAQLWRRIVFNILISNTDDHLHNHAFLYEAGGWRLAPAYDLNPVPADIKPRVLTLAIDEADGTASLDLALAVAAHFGLKGEAPRKIAAEVGAAVASWRQEAKKLGLITKEIDRMASAFEHDDLAKAAANSARQA
jgi:serine/threonine-protein kinase HipA